MNVLRERREQTPHIVADDGCYRVTARVRQAEAQVAMPV
jgi:hypothetical protein